MLGILDQGSQALARFHVEQHGERHERDRNHEGTGDDHEIHGLVHGPRDPAHVPKAIGHEDQHEHGGAEHEHGAHGGTLARADRRSLRGELEPGMVGLPPIDRHAVNLRDLAGRAGSGHGHGRFSFGWRGGRVSCSRCWRLGRRKGHACARSACGSRGSRRSCDPG